MKLFYVEIQEQIWELLGNLGYDLDDDEEASELADETISKLSDYFNN